MHAGLRVLLLASVTVVAPSAAAQIGYRDLMLRNPTTHGSSTVQTRVYYPAEKTGQGTELSQSRSDYPVVAFLPGMARAGADYRDIGAALAAEGYVAFLVGKGDPTSQLSDARALSAALVHENLRAGSFLKGRLDVDHMALVGHSLGGGNTIRTLAENPRFVVGVALAPWTSYDAKGFVGLAGKVRVPILMIAGQGDHITPWDRDAAPVWDALTAYRGIKAITLFDRSAHHVNLAAWSYQGATALDKAVFTAAFKSVSGFLDRYVRGRHAALEDVVGVSARKRLGVVAIRAEVRTPEYWHTGSFERGRTATFHLLANEGWAAHLYANKAVRTPTPWGDLWLEDRSMALGGIGLVDSVGTLILAVPLPSEKSVAGIEIVMQGLAVGRDGIALSNAIRMKVE